MYYTQERYTQMFRKIATQLSNSALPLYPLITTLNAHAILTDKLDWIREGEVASSDATDFFVFFYFPFLAFHPRVLGYPMQM